MNELNLRYDGDSQKLLLRLRCDGKPDQAAEAPFPDDVAPDQDERERIRWYFEDFLLYPYGLFVDRAKEAVEMLEQIGQRLFDAAFGDRKTGRLYELVADDLTDTRIVVESGGPFGWALPWELLRDPERNSWLVQKARAFVRSHPQTVGTPAALPGTAGAGGDGDECLNLLLVVCRPDGPDRDVPFQSVARPLLDVFRKHRAQNRVRIDVLRPPSFQRLTEVLNEKPGFYHVLHFDGHGVFREDPSAAQGSQGVLIFENHETSEKDHIKGRQLGELLRGASVPLVVLNACQSGMTSPDAAYGSVGQQLLASGVRGAVAMAWSVYVPTAARFLAKMYDGLLQGRTLAQSVNISRQMLWADPQRPTARGRVVLQDWPVPVLFEAAGDEPLRVFPERDELATPAITVNLDAQTAGTAGSSEKVAGEVGLPDPPDYGFVGRDSLLLELERAFRDETIVLLEALAGSGKTSAATAFARWWLETGGLVDDDGNTGAAVFFSFERYLPVEQVVDRVLGTFEPMLRQKGIDWQHIRDADERRRVSLQVLRQNPCLLILDNFEPVAGFSGQEPALTSDERQALVRFLRDLRGGATRVLITSRRDEPWLGRPIYRKIVMGGLTHHEAREFAGLVLKRAGSRLPELTVETESSDPYDRLLQFLNGNPLAIQVILPVLAEGIAPARLLQELITGEAELPDDATHGRERSLAAALGYGLDRLDTGLQRRLALLALFKGSVFVGHIEMLSAQAGEFLGSDSCSLSSELMESLTAISNRDIEAWDADLMMTAQAGLLQAVGRIGAYMIHPALPWFLHAKFQSAFGSISECLESAFVSVFAVAGYEYEQSFETQTELVLRLLSMSEDNLRHALHLARRYKLWEDALGIFYALNRLLYVNGRIEERRRLVATLAADVTDQSGGHIEDAEHLWLVAEGYRASIALDDGDCNESRSIHLKLMKHSQQRLPSPLKTCCFEASSIEAYLNRNVIDGLTPVEKDALHNVATSLQNLGVVDSLLNRHGTAERLFLQSLSIKRLLGNRHGEAKALHHLGLIAFARRDLEAAEDWHEQSLAIEREVGNMHGQAASLHELGIVAFHKGDLQQADHRFHESLDISDALGDPAAISGSLDQLSLLALTVGDDRQAERYSRRSLEISERIGDVQGKLNALRRLGQIAESRGDFDEAEAWYRQCSEFS